MNEFEKTVQAINKRFGKNTMLLASSVAALNKRMWIPTGMPAIDACFGGGLPVSSIISFMGNESSGKTLLALKLVAATQRYCRHTHRVLYDWDEITCTRTKTKKKWLKESEPMKVVWIDVENAFDNQWAKKFGVDIDNLFIIKPAYAEQAIDVVTSLIDCGKVDLIVIDSVSSLAGSVEIEKSAEDSQYATLAKLMSKGLKVWTSRMNEQSFSSPHTCSLLMINQIRLKMGGYGNPETMPGGKALPFYSAIIAKVKKGKFVEAENGLTIGHRLEVVAVKNKLAPPNRSVALEINTVGSEGIIAGSSNYCAQIITLGLQWGLIRKAGSWLTLAEGVRLQGVEKSAAFLAKPQNKKLRLALEKEIYRIENEARHSRGSLALDYDEKTGEIIE